MATAAFRRVRGALGSDFRKEKRRATTTTTMAMETFRKGRKLCDIEWDHSFITQLPGDKEEGGRTRQVHGALFSRVEPTPSGNAPYVIAHSREAAALLELDETECTTSDDFAKAFSGKTGKIK